MVCLACGRGFNRDCRVCVERFLTVSPIAITDEFDWPTHEIVWDDTLMSGLHCQLCGVKIEAYTTLREIIGPCSGGGKNRPPLPKPSCGPGSRGALPQ